jgi:hypothetical protein
MAILDGYPLLGGVHSESAALAHVLGAMGVPLSEAMIFGIGGGPGAGYILWDFKEHNAKILVMGFHHLWNYPTRFYENLCARIGVRIAMPETGSRKAAEQTLNDALAAGKPALAWVDPAFMPYFQHPASSQGHMGHILAVCGHDGDDYLLDDRATSPFRVPASIFADGRARIGSYKHRLLLVEDTDVFDLAAAVKDGIAACIDYLSSDSESFSLPALRKWGKLIGDGKNKKGWQVVFADRVGLYSTLKSIYENIEQVAGAGGLRGLYADFLNEAASVTSNDGLREAAAHYAALAERWRLFARAALPDDVPALAETKALMNARHALIMQGGEAWRGSTAQTEKLRELSARLNVDFPLDDTGITRLFADLQAHLLGIYEAEVAALAALKAAVV